MEESTNASLSSFTQAPPDEISKIIQKSAAKSCSSDTLPTWLLKEHLEVMLPVITDIVNLSLSTGVFPDQMKYASVKPLLKKSGLHRNFFRPIFSLSYLSKLIGEVVATPLSNYMDENNLSEPMQSAYRSGHSTKTA